MKKIAVILLACAAAIPVAAQYSTIEKPFEVTAGATFWQGDHKDAGVDNGFLVGLDYYLQQNNPNSMYGVGVRGMFGSGGGIDSTTLGAHGILRGSFAYAGESGADFFYKLAAGLYWTELSNGTTNDEFGFGAWGSIGYQFNTGDGQMGTPFSIEVGYFFAPSVNGVDNNGFFAAAGIRF
ncbi:MAG: hypothetical protein KatS3mg015_2692 [Fimbriimonadales bacterium]|nr:MAG: hypothetical protein KatS3mg015_2692 [Fimbriimonadales bacterium]